jgi:hypothetical protein
MIQLLDSAIQVSRSDKDKFIFLSDSHVPVKSFQGTWDLLVQDGQQASRFCILPNEFRRGYGLQQDASKFTFKTSQWLILSQAHALKVLKNKDEPFTLDYQQWGCKDEWWFWLNTVGAVELKPHWTMSDLATPEAEAQNAAQLACDTYVDWTQMAASYETSLLGMNGTVKISTEGQDGLAGVQRGPKGPQTISELSDDALGKYRDSDFIFIRKVFADSVEYKGPGTVVDAFSRLIFHAMSQSAVNPIASAPFA